MSTELSLRDFAPEPMLVTDSHLVHSAKFRAIDAHNHLGRWLSADHSWTVPDVSALLAVMDSCNLQAIINLDGMWGDELECNLDRYDRAHPGRFHTFAQCDWSLVLRPDFGPRMARQLEQSAAQGAKGLKVWKHLGLRYRDADDVLIPIDDQRLDDLWHTAGQLRLPVMIHVADPVAFFRPLDPTNERWEQLHVHPEWHFPSPPYPSFSVLLEQFERLIARHPATTFIGAHVGCYAENLRWVARMCDTYANFAVDIAARVAELGRQPYTAKWFLSGMPTESSSVLTCSRLVPLTMPRISAFLRRPTNILATPQSPLVEMGGGKSMEFIWVRPSYGKSMPRMRPD